MKVGWWPKPDLTCEGQTIFWDKQAPFYETADMTTDNPQEIVYVIEQFQKNKYEEIITLGGAVGCRDPYMILQRAYCRFAEKCSLGSNMPKRIFFNDLSLAQVQYAQSKILNPCIQHCGLEIIFQAGNALDACQTFGEYSRKPRVLFLGVYKLEGFFRAIPEENYPENGFTCYINNRQVLGNHFWYDLLCFQESELRVYPLDTQLCLIEQTDQTEEVLKRLSELLKNYRPYIALQIVGAHKNLPGFFLSHWYKLEPLRELLEIVFEPKRFSISCEEFPKGYVFQIQRKSIKAQGAITILNNVLGNILPEEQIATLKAIKDIL